MKDVFDRVDFEEFVQYCISFVEEQKVETGYMLHDTPLFLDTFYVVSKFIPDFEAQKEQALKQLKENEISVFKRFNKYTESLGKRYLNNLQTRVIEIIKDLNR